MFAVRSEASDRSLSVTYLAWDSGAAESVGRGPCSEELLGWGVERCTHSAPVVQWFNGVAVFTPHKA